MKVFHPLFTHNERKANNNCSVNGCKTRHLSTEDLPEEIPCKIQQIKPSFTSDSKNELRRDEKRRWSFLLTLMVIGVSR